MMIKNFRGVAFATGLFSAAGILPVPAELPSMSEKDNLGYFVVARNRSFNYGLTANGKGSMKLMNPKGGEISSKLAIGLDFSVLETMPDGKVISRQIKAETLESAQEATDKPKDVVFKGKVTGDIEFEAYISEDRGGILLGGRLLNAGALKNPTRFVIDMKFPTTLPEAKSEPTKKDTKAYEDKIKDDKVQLKWTDGKKAKIDANEDVEGSSKEVSGPGISAAVVEFSAYSDRKIQATASPNSSMVISNKDKGPLSSGFSLVWSADVAKDPDGKARLSVDVK